jgi:site-specific recombinase XerD
MVRRTFSIMFMIRRGQLLQNQEAPVYMRITIDGERAEISLKRSIDPALWNEARGCAKPTTQYAKDLNFFLEQMRHKVYEHQQELISRNKLVTASSLKNAFLNRGDDQKRTILQIYEEHNKVLHEKINKGTARNTYIRHTTSKKHLERFIQSQYGKQDLYLRDIDHAFITKYETWLRTKRDCNNNTTVKYIRNLGKIIRDAMKNDWIKVDPFRHIKLRTEEVDKPFLSKSELDLIINKEIKIARISQVRDIFVFCCFTGLAFVDVQSLCPKDLETGGDGNLWIKKQRHKSKQWAHIPLLPASQQILDRYKIHPECIRKGVLLPVSSNQKMNAYLKEVADLCGITKNLTTHCARHTFATTVTLANNISMESVSKMLGHSSLAMTKKYARILDTTISKEMDQLAKKMIISNN